ncbi:MAG: gliding motility-associated C-terminal domain-containing protein, partial [bacterium]|nr:gliding motility-associated C-terminal domain-containing protein [bacterium]
VTWGTMTHEWYFDYLNNVDDSTNEENPIHTYPADTTSYYVFLKSKFTYPMSQDPLLTEDFICSDTTSQGRKIGPDVTVFVPTAFSPEGTGPKLNNTFYAVVNGEKSFHIELFNRWGELLWQTDNKYETWNGRYKNGDCQQDVYAWVVKVTAYDGEEYRYEGTVSLLR